MSGDFHKIGNIKGANGVGVPEGGQRGQVLRKVGDTDFATGWGSVNYADVEGKVPKSALPDLGIAPMPVKSEAEMLNLPAVVGNMAIRTDLGKTFVLMEEPASTLGNWLELVTTSDVQSVNGQTGNVQLTKADVGLSKVDNTADSDKPEATTSVRGLMSAADKAKLNNATAVSYANRMVMRDASGGVRHKYVTIDNAPKNNSDAATKSYVDTEVGQRVKVLGPLGSGVDLNNLAEDAVGVQTTSANAKLELNYPEYTAGAIQVITASTMVYQYYTTYHPSTTKIFWRTKYAGTWGAWKQLVDTAMLNTEITAAKKHTDDRFNLVAGGSVLSTTDWDAMRSTASTGVVEGWIKGCPAGGKINTTYNMSNGFVKDPVWKLEVRPEGLNYVTQRATLLNCAPKFMIGFAWERIYNPAAAKWSKWTCVAGDTGGIRGQIGGSVTQTDIEAPFRSIETSTTHLYRKSEPLTIHRIAGTIRFFGAMTSTKLDDLVSTSADVAPVLMYMASSSDSPAGNPGGEYSIGGGQNYTFPPQSGSYRNHWTPTTVVNAESFKLLAARYGPNTPSNAPWLPFNITWPAPQLNTYTGSGFLPPAIPAQSSTGND